MQPLKEMTSVYSDTEKTLGHEKKKAHSSQQISQRKNVKLLEYP